MLGKIFIKPCLLLVWLLTDIAAPSLGLAKPGTPHRVVDGDTIIIRYEDTSLCKIRLYGVDCPERSQPGGREATALATSTLTGSMEIVEYYQDRYHRTVATVVLKGGTCLQEILLREGLAWVDERYCDRPECAGWRELQHAARRERRGLWQEPAPVSPWQWRRRR